MGFKIYSSTLDICDLNSDGIGKLLQGVPSGRICGIVFYGVDERVEYHALLSRLKSAVCRSLGRRTPVTLVPQYLLPKGGLSADIYALDGTSDITIRERDGICYGLLGGGEGKGEGKDKGKDKGEESLLFIEGIPASDFTQSVGVQSQEVFERLDATLAECGFAVDDIVRQWNYIGNIVGERDGKQRYQEFNDARTRYYAKAAWSNGYPAATGIGASYEGIIVGCIAFKKSGTCAKAIYPIDNPLQVAAHVYSKSVLIDNAADAVKSTPKFERAKLIETSHGVCCFVSGTAAIRGEQSEDASSARLQTIKTIENIEHLVSPENLVRYGCAPHELKYAQLQAFIKRAEDYDEVRAVIEQAYPQVPTVYTIADVCRKELLVEIEGILI